METYYESKYAKIQFDPARSILFSYWFTPEDMSDAAYRKEFEAYEQIAIKLKPKNKLVNIVKSKYAIPVETHAWVTSKLNKLHELYEIKKVATVMSINLLAQLSRELVNTEVDSKETEKHFFESEAKALTWLEGIENTAEKAA